MRLFRTEAQTAHRPRLQGEIVVRGSWVVWTLTTVVMACMLAILTLIFYTEYTRRVTVSGYLIPVGGVVRIYSPQAGRAVQVHVAEGDIVSAGQALATVTDERPDATGSDARAKSAQQIAERRNNLKSVIKQQDQLYTQTTRGLNLRIAALYQEMAQLLEEQKTQSSRVGYAKNALKRNIELAAQNYVSEAVVQEKQEAVADQQSKLQALQRTHAGLRRELEGLKAELSELPMRKRTQVAELERGVTQAQQDLIDLESKKEIVVTSPQAGQISGLSVKPSQLVSVDKSLMMLLPGNQNDPTKSGELEAHLFAQSKDVGFLLVGQVVKIRYGAFPYQKFGQYNARIVEVSRTPFLPNELPFPTASKALTLPTDEPVYRIRVTLDSQTASAYGVKQSLQSGMQLEADVMLDTRTVAQWILEPLYSLRGRYIRE
jgi:membrane fusion protein